MADDYNPFEHREVESPTTDLETFGHLVKGCLGGGILAMPFAFLNAGIWFGLVGTIISGIIMTYCMHILIHCSHVLSRRARVPSMLYSDIAEAAFQNGPECSKKMDKGRAIVDSLLCTVLLGTCTVYIVFIAANVKQVIDYYYDTDFNIRLLMLVLFPFLVLLCQIRTLKYLAPFSMLANILITISIIICYYYSLMDTPHISERPTIASFERFPTFFGTVIFSLAGTGVIMHIENDMKNPGHMIGCCSVLNFGMIFVTGMYAVTGFLGYLKYGDETLASLSLNLPQNEILAQSVKLLMSAAIFMTYSLQFYVPVNIIWTRMKPRFEKNDIFWERVMRFLLNIVCLLIAVAIPNIGPLISLLGALIFSTVAIIVPAILDLVTFWGEGNFALRIIVDFSIIIFGFIALFTGTYTSINDIVKTYG